MTPRRPREALPLPGEAQGAAEHRPLGATAATALVIANMIGTGIFMTTGFLAARLGSPLMVLAVWALGAVLALCGAAVYAELGAMMPRAGGEYVYLSRAFHPAVGFVAGFVSLVVGFAAPIAATAYAFGAYLHAAIPAIPTVVAAVGVIGGLTALHMRDVSLGGRVQTALSAYKVLVIVAFIAAAALFGRGDMAHLTVTAPAPSAADLAVCLVFVSFAYSGWNAAAYVAGELRDPGRTLPRSLLWGTGTVAALYLLLNVVFFYGAGPAALAASPEDVADVAARGLFGVEGGRTFSLAIALALVSSISAMVLTGPRVAQAMAEDGLLVGALARRSGRRVPWVSVAAQGGLAIAIATTATFEDLLTYIGFTLSLFAALTVVGAFVLRRREPDAPRPFRAFGWPLTPLLFLALSLWMVVASILDNPLVAAWGAGTLAVGFALYLLRIRFGVVARPAPVTPGS